MNQNDKNLLAAGGHDKNVTIYDRRVSKVVKIFEHVHESKILLVSVILKTIFMFSFRLSL